MASKAIIVRPGAGRVYPLEDGNSATIAFGDVETTRAFISGLFEIKPGNRAPLHTHDRLTEVGHVLRGELRLYFDQEVSLVSPGTFFMTPPGVVHAYHNPGEAAVVLVTFNLPGGDASLWQAASEILSQPVANQAAVDPSGTRPTWTSSGRGDG